VKDSLVIALGANIHQPKTQLFAAQTALNQIFELVMASRIYYSKAQDYLDQPDFYNQVIEYKKPHHLNASQCMNILLELELKLGRKRDIAKGPRTIDLDIIFYGDEKINLPKLTIPHPSWIQRSFVVQPMRELPCFQSVEKCFIIPKMFELDATPID
jgi:2-amino-4-hydroxy-6-hydroxymethyldihydropteridine diphosphokinase